MACCDREVGPAMYNLNKIWLIWTVERVHQRLSNQSFQIARSVPCAMPSAETPIPSGRRRRVLLPSGRRRRLLPPDRCGAPLMCPEYPSRFPRVAWAGTRSVEGEGSCFTLWERHHPSFRSQRDQRARTAFPASERRGGREGRWSSGADARHLEAQTRGRRCRGRGAPLRR